MYQEELKSSNLAKFLNDYDYVFVDTCSLMEDSFPLFMDHLTSSKEYWRDELQVIVLGECLEELKKHSKEKDKERISSKIAATRALKIIKHDKWRSKTLTITKCDGDSFADNAIFTKVSSLRIHNKILVITQDKTLTTDLLKLNKLDSQKGRYLSVYRLNQQSELEKNPGENSEKPFNKKHDASSFQKVEKDNKVTPLTKAQRTLIQEDSKLAKSLLDQKYKLKNKIRDIDDQILRINKIGKESLTNLKLHFQKEDLLKKKAELLSSKKPAKENKKETPEIQPQTIITKGKKASEALKRLALNYHSIVRDNSVPYVPEVHGELNLTMEDLVNVDLLSSKKGDFTYSKGGIVYSFIKGNEYSVSCSRNSSKETKSKKPSTSPKEKKATPIKGKEKPLIDESLSKKKIKVVKVKGVTSGGSSSAIPEGIILVVGEPKKKPVRKEEKVAIIKNNSLLDEAIAADRILNANLNNPNYPKEKSLLEIKKQKERLKKLDAKDLKSFQLKLSDLERLEKAKSK